jgi:UDP:flavonoid glycosyltransferase YjiC (YdhE family)
MIVLPLFWDQYDNAQRMHELGLGVRLNAYRFTDAELQGTLDRLLTDARLHSRLATAAATIRQRDGVRKAAGLIEQTAAS